MDGGKTIICQLDAAAKGWVQERTVHPWVEDSCGVVAMRDKTPIGAIVFDSITPNSCHAHMCLDSPMALRSALLPIAFDFAFNHLKVGVMIAGIPSTNLRMLKLAAHMGFTLLGDIPDALEVGISRVIMTMRREECPWLFREAA